MKKKPTPPRTKRLVKAQLADNSFCEAEIVYYPKYRSFLRAGACCIELHISGLGSFFHKSPDYFEALFRIRKELETKGIRLLCWGARKDVWPSFMQRDMGAGLVAYELLEDGSHNPEQSIFEYAPPEAIGTVAEQKENAERWYQNKHRNSK